MKQKLKVNSGIQFPNLEKNMRIKKNWSKNLEKIGSEKFLIFFQNFEKIHACKFKNKTIILKRFNWILINGFGSKETNSKWKIWEKFSCVCKLEKKN